MRQTVVAALVSLSDDPDAAARVLRLGATQREEIAHNARLVTAATMSAMDRYTGVLYDALGADTLDAPARAWLRRHVAIHSAPFGLVGAGDAIPNYRMGVAVRMPGLPQPKQLWADATADALTAASPGFVLDLRSDAYRATAPIPAEVASGYVRVLAATPDGTGRALNHFNKHSKGSFVRDLATARPRVNSERALLRWAGEAGWTMRSVASGELELIVGAH